MSERLLLDVTGIRPRGKELLQALATFKGMSFDDLATILLCERLEQIASQLPDLNKPAGRQFGGYYHLRWSIRDAIAHLQHHPAGVSKEVIADLRAFIANLSEAIALVERLRDTSPSEVIADLSDLEMPTRIYAQLRCNDIDTVGQLCRLSAEQLTKMRGIGHKSIADIRTVLTRYGLALHGDAAAAPTTATAE